MPLLCISRKAMEGLIVLEQSMSLQWFTVIDSCSSGNRSPNIGHQLIVWSTIRYGIRIVRESWRSNEISKKFLHFFRRQLRSIHWGRLSWVRGITWMGTGGMLVIIVRTESQKANVWVIRVRDTLRAGRPGAVTPWRGTRGPMPLRWRRPRGW